tara:strand:- start:482 stop:1051 length:570 start_codon:yes stop_codon:yes gene_type:complete
MIKTLLLFTAVLTVIVLSLVFIVGHHDDLQNRIQFSLTDHHGQSVNGTSFAGKHQLVFFGFTSCDMVCPTQLAKITDVMKILEEKGKAHRVNPLFITVDPERDSPEVIMEYLSHFDQRIVGLTGSREALESTTDAFKTLLASAPAMPQTGYQISHSSLVYIVDPFSRVIDYLPFESDTQAMANKLLNYL